MLDLKNILSQYSFSPVISLPKTYEILDFSKGVVKSKVDYTIGRYNEVRPGMYTSEQYSGNRNIHMGIDIGAPQGTSVMSFYHGKVLFSGVNSLPLDYGGTVIIEYSIGDIVLYALYGHLSLQSVSENPIGKSVKAGEVFAKLGSFDENGGWPSHLHFQLCIYKPEKCDMPGVVSLDDHEQALSMYPDPRLVLGNLY